MNRSFMYVCVWIACTPFAGACSSPALPGTASYGQNHPATLPAEEDDPSALPRWPRTDIAERRFSGDRMFIERDAGEWRAWIVSSPDRGRVKAMDFFTGTTLEGRIEARPEHRDGAPQRYTLTDDRGRQHGWSTDASFQNPPGPDDNRGARYFGSGGIALDFGNTLFASDAQRLCPLELHVVARVPDAGDRAHMSSSWARVAMYHAPAGDDCPSGQWISEISSALDLRDGTWLAAMGDYVFRLRMKDLAPAGRAPTLRVIEASKAASIAESLRNARADDPNASLSRALGLAAQESHTP